jgi:hypothetical protein
MLSLSDPRRVYARVRPAPVFRRWYGQWRTGIALANMTSGSGLPERPKRLLE